MSPMLLAQLSSGVQLAYLDSGPVPGSDTFTTVVIFHGLQFNCHGFEHLFPLAPKYNLRLVSVQRRGYAGSSRYTKGEMAQLTDQPGAFWVDTGALVARFIFYLVKNTMVCEPNENRSQGGITVLGWSIGVVFSMTILGAGRDVVGQEVHDVVEQYLTSVILYDPPLSAFGLRLPKDVYEPPPYFPRTIPDFRTWISSYFNQPDQWNGSLAELDSREVTERCTISFWSQEYEEKCIETTGLGSDDPVIRNESVQRSIGDLTSESLFDLIPETRVFPRAGVVIIHGNKSAWPTVVGYSFVRERYIDLLNRGHEQNLRPVRFETVEWGNHFIHADYPDEFLKIVKASAH